jgi:hypothetical protein
MKKHFMFLSKLYLTLVKLFSHSESVSERKLFGLGQFVLLLTLTPYIFNLSLYSFSNDEKIPSHYEYDATRFNLLNQYLIKPKDLSKNDMDMIDACKKWESSKKQSNNQFVSLLNKLCVELNDKHLIYKIELNRFNKTQAFREGLDVNFTCKPPLSCLKVEKTNSPSMTNLLGLNVASNAWQLMISPSWYLGLILIFPTVLLSLKRQLSGLLILGLAAPAFNYIVFILVFVLGLDSIANWQINHTLIPKISFVWFALKGQMRAKSFIYFILLLLISTIIPVLINDAAAFNTTKAQLPILVFIAVAAVARLVVKGARENFYLLQNLGWSKGIKTARHAFLLWLPLFIIASPFLYVTEVALPTEAVNTLHDRGILTFNHKHNIRDNALQSAALKADNLMYKWYLEIEKVKSEIKKQGDKITQEGIEKSVMQAVDSILPTGLTFNPHESDAWWPANEVVNLSVDASTAATNTAFTNFIKEMKGNLSDFLKSKETTIKEGAQNAQETAQKQVDTIYEIGRDTILKANRDSQTTLWWTMTYISAAHQLSLLIFGFVCVKSFMYVFARVSFNRDTGTFVTLGDSQLIANQNNPSPIISTGREYIIKSNKTESYFISRRFQCRGKAPKFNIPQAFYAPIARIFNGAYTMNKVTMQKGDDEVSCSATKGMEFFEWTLSENETVIFDFHYFVGMTESIKVSTLISPRMSSLLLGRMIFSQATGPGKLILMAKGRAEIIDNQETTGSLPPERLIAMHKQTRLHIDSELDPLNIYLSTAYIRPAGGGKIIVDVDSQRGSTSGLASFIKHFILPI